MSPDVAIRADQVRKDAALLREVAKTYWSLGERFQNDDVGDPPPVKYWMHTNNASADTLEQMADFLIRRLEMEAL